MQELIDNIMTIVQSPNFQFGRPRVFWLLPLPLLILLLPAVKYRAEALYAPFFRDVLQLKGGKLRRGVSISRRNFLQVLLMILVWGALVTALAAPQLVGEPEKQIRTARSFLIAADLSLSMEVRDWISKDGRRLSRWDAVKEVMGDFIERREGDRMGLIFFGSQAYLQAPFTTDLPLVQALLEESYVGMAGRMTAIGNAIGKSVELFEADTVEHRVLLLLTDGQDSGSELPPVQAARLAALDSIRIYTLGIGDPNSGAYDLDERTLEAIAGATGGRYFRAQNRQRLEEVYAELDQLEPIEYEDEQYIPTRQLFYYPLALALFLALGYHLLAGGVAFARYFWIILGRPGKSK